MKILFASGEAVPFIKTGGLGDVAQSLPYEISKNIDMDIRVIIPYYKCIKENPSYNIEYVTSFYMPLSWRNVYVGIFKGEYKGVVYYFVDNDYYFGRDLIYSYNDDGERFAFFSKAITECLFHIGFFPDVIHLNDWQTALVTLFLKAFYKDLENYGKIRTLFTIHNIEYQGIADLSFLGEVCGISNDFLNVAEFDGRMNFMKTAIVLCDKLTTVSQTYSYEIRYAFYAHRLENILNENSYKITGIINGIDTEIFNPKTDRNIPYNFSIETIGEKEKDKLYLQKRLNLSVDSSVPVICLISRLVGHKGMDLIEYVKNEIMNLNLQLVIIGTGEEKYENLFREMAYRNPGKISANITFSNELASLVYAGSDFLLMPSKSEPCGLSQLIAMRYGTIPIVRETGGLVDTVPPFNSDNQTGRGFTFKGYNAHDMLGSIERAVGLYGNKGLLYMLRKNIMEYDSSFFDSSKKYIELYQSMKGR